jgi:hypothetical protein
MTYAVTNPPAKLGGQVGGRSLWLYVSADADGTVNGSGYFTNGVSLGMQTGDAVIVVDTTTPLASFCYVASVSGDAATTGFGAVA